ncbi:hypothetical protein CsSME_00019064 [Camellia sinensis var. sinensis]
MEIRARLPVKSLLRFRKIVKLPPSLTPVTSNVPKLPSIVGTAVGFGFDQRSNDYKVVKIGYLVDYKSGLDVPWTVEIYFLNTHSWRRYNCVADFCSETFCFGTFSAFANGAVHWIAFVSGLWILRFDMGGEVFREMTLPNHLVKLRDSTTIYVMVLGELLAVVQCDYYSSSQTFQIWTNGDVLMVAEEEKLVWNDPQSQQIKKHLGVNGSYHSFYVFTYMESLVALDAPNGVGKDNPNSLDAVVNKEASRAVTESGDQLQERRSIKLEGRFM